MIRRAVITGDGLISGLGDGRSVCLASLLDGQSALRPIASFPVEGVSGPIAGEIPDFDAENYLGDLNLRPLDRPARLLASAVKLGLQSAGFAPESIAEREVGLVAGTVFASASTISKFDRRALKAGPSLASPLEFANTVINSAASQAAICHDLRGVNATISAGSASGLLALVYAADLTRSGRLDAVLAGGVEELCAETYLGFNRSGLLADAEGTFAAVPFDARRNGFALAEGAVVLMIEERESALARGGTILAEVLGHGTRFDLGRSRDPATARSTYAACMLDALRASALGPEHIGHVQASANGSVVLDHAEALALTDVFAERNEAVPVTAVKSMLGESLGASGGFQAAVAVESLRLGMLPGTRGLESTDSDVVFPGLTTHSQPCPSTPVLINGFGPDGHCCSLVLSA